jgi:RNA polymerase sigma-70 factor (ECF subfamily)
MPGEPMQLPNEQQPQSSRGRGEHGLLKRIGARDREALRELYVLYRPRLARFLRRMSYRHDLVDELINDTLMVVWDKAQTFRGDSLVSTWIMGIAYRRGLNRLRTEHRAHERMVLPTIEEQPARHHADQADLAELLEQALASLSADQRAVLELTYYLGHSCREIAAIMRCPINTVKTRMFHARNKLRKLVPVLAESPGGGADASGATA